MDPFTWIAIMVGSGMMLAARSKSKKTKSSFDELFVQYGKGIPVEYLRALAMKESGMRPRLKGKAAWGLMQVVEVVRKDYNEHHGTNYTRNDLLDPEISISMASDVLQIIIRGYLKNHPRAINLQEDWSNPRFVELLTFGWNAGFSERGGVGKVTKYLAKKGITDFTIDDVYKNAEKAGAASTLSNYAKVKWCKGVARQYLIERKKGVG